VGGRVNCTHFGAAMVWQGTLREKFRAGRNTAKRNIFIFKKI